MMPSPYTFLCDTNWNIISLNRAAEQFPLEAEETPNLFWHLIRDNELARRLSGDGELMFDWRIQFPGCSLSTFRVIKSLLGQEYLQLTFLPLVESPDVSREAETFLSTEERFARLGVLMGGMIHNVNNHLNALMGAVQLLEISYPEQPDIKRLTTGLDALDREVKTYTVKFLREKHLKPVTDFRRFLEDELQFFRADLLFKHATEVVLEFSEQAFQGMVLPALPLTTFMFRLLEWLDGFIRKTDRTRLVFRDVSVDGRTLLEIEVISPFLSRETKAPGLVPGDGSGGSIHLSSPRSDVLRIRYDPPQL